jgi:CBS domain-containing protein
VCSREVTTISPSRPVNETVKLMREKAIRRLPVVDRGTPVGVVSIGDLAIERDPRSALADISQAPPNT